MVLDPAKVSQLRRLCGELRFSSSVVEQLVEALRVVGSIPTWTAQAPLVWSDPT